MTETDLGLPDRFWSKVQRTDGCWIWTAAKDPNGYGVFGLGTREQGTRRAHIVSFEAANGPTPKGLLLDHRCRNKSCVNPSHLHAVTCSQNMQNLSGPHRDSRSGVRGVYWEPRRKRWTGQVCIDGRKHSIGHYRDLAGAERAITELRNELHTNNLADREKAS